MAHYISVALKMQLYLSGIQNKPISLCGPGLLPPHIISQWRTSSFTTESTKRNNKQFPWTTIIPIQKNDDDTTNKNV